MAEARATLDEAIEWLEMPVDGLGGKNLGRVAGIHIDATDGQPRWVLVRLGPLAGCTAIAVEHVAEVAERVWAGYERDAVQKAPRFKPEDSLTASQELELVEHFGSGKGRGRAAELAGRDPDEITAVPAEVED
jgi:hypothetical protein